MKNIDTMIKNHGKFKLIRDSSKVSEEAEKFLQNHNLPYRVVYADEMDCEDELPWIYSPCGTIPYVGKGGFNIFRDNYDDKYCKK